MKDRVRKEILNMDRRRFLTQSSLAGAGLIGITGANQNRLYGLPASSLEITESVNVVVPHLFRLHLAIAGLRIEYADCCAAVSRLAVDILQDPSSAENFVNDPDGYLEQAGFVGSSLNTNTPEFRIALALASPEVRQAAIAGDPVAFLNALGSTQAKAGNPDVLPPPGFVNINALVNITAVLNVVAGLNVGAAINAAVLSAAVVVLLVVTITIVAASSPVNGTPEVTVASVLGGKQFAHDVTRTQARREIDALIAAIQNGSWQLPEGVQPTDAIKGLILVRSTHLI